MKTKQIVEKDTWLARYRHIWLPAVLFVYFLVMAWYGRDMLTVEHQTVKYFTICAVEVLIIIALSIFLKKRRKLRLDRQDLHRRTDEIINTADNDAHKD